MNTIESALYSIKQFFKKNGGTILTCLAAGGMVATSVLSGRAAIKIHEKLKEDPEAETKEKIKKAAPDCILPVSVGATTLACMFGANALNRKQQASLLAASALLSQAYRRYKDKADELLGEGKVETELAKDGYDQNKQEIDDGEQLFYYNYYTDNINEDFGFYFTAKKEDVLKAEYELNRTFNIRKVATLNDFARLLNLKDIEGGNEIGWAEELGYYYGYSWIDFEHYNTVMEDGLECTIITTPFCPCTLDK